MQFDMRALPPLDRYKLLTSSVTPRPIAWVTSRSPDGRNNAAPYSFFNAMGNDPPVVVLGLLRRPDGTPKDTAANILETGEFVANLVSEADAGAMNITCMDAPPDVDEIDCAKLQTAPSTLVAPPRIATAPVSFECRLVQSVSLSARQVIIIAEVLMAHVADRFVLDAERLHLDTAAMTLIGRMHGSGWYLRSTDRFQMKRPSYAEWAAAQGKT